MGAKAVEQAAAETKEEKKKKDAAKSDPAAQAQLLKDVAAFAAELGFASGGLAPAADDAAFADFAPEAAKKQFGEGKKGKQEQKAKAPATDDLKKSGKAATDDDAQQYQKGKQGSKAAGPQERKQQQQQKKEQPEQQQEQPAEQPKLPARDWNFGVGPRPGTLVCIIDGKAISLRDALIWTRHCQSFASPCVEMLLEHDGFMMAPSTWLWYMQARSRANPS
jgi:hypothetical protein